MNGSKLAKTGAIITLISLSGKALGFLREILLAKYFGTSYIVDAYLMSIYIPSILYGWLPAIAVGYVPVYYEVAEEKKNRYTSNVLNLTFMVALVAIAISLMLDTELVRLVAPGFDEVSVSLTIEYFNVTIWLILFNTPIQILISYLNCRNLFIFSNVSNLCLSLIQAIFVVLSAHINISLLPYGILVSYIVQFVILTIFSRKHKYRHSFRIKFDSNIKKLLPVIIPIFISNSLVDINSFVDKFLASELDEGSISALSYAGTLRSFILLVFTTAITTMFYPKLSELLSQKKFELASSIVEKIIDFIIVLFVPLTVGAILLSEEIITCVFLRGAFNENSLETTKWPFIMYAVALVFMALRDVIIKILYANKDSKSNIFFGGANIVLNIIFNLLLIKELKHIGLALATSIACILTFPAYVFKLKSVFKSINLRQRIKTLVIALVAATIMAVTIILLKVVLKEVLQCSMIKMMLGTVLLVAIGTISYVVGLLILCRKNKGIAKI